MRRIPSIAGRTLAAIALLLAGARESRSQSATEGQLPEARLQHQQAQQQLLSARQAAVETRARLASLVEQRTQLESEMENLATREPRLNPLWEQSAGDLAALATKRDRLAERLTRSHPDLQAVEAEYREREARHRALSKYVEDPSATAAQCQSRRQSLDELQGRIDAARRDAALAEQQLFAAEAAERRALEDRLAVERVAAALSPDHRPSGGTNFTSGSLVTLIALLICGAALLTRLGGFAKSKPSTQKIPARSAAPAKLSPARRVDTAASNAPVAPAPKPRVPVRRRS